MALGISWEYGLTFMLDHICSSIEGGGGLRKRRGFALSCITDKKRNRKGRKKRRVVDVEPWQGLEIIRCHHASMFMPLGDWTVRSTNSSFLSLQGLGCRITGKERG